MLKLKWDHVICLHKPNAILAAYWRQLCMGLVWPFGEQEGQDGARCSCGAVPDAMSHHGDVTGSDLSLVRQKLLAWIWTSGMKKPSWNL